MKKKHTQKQPAPLTLAEVIRPIVDLIANPAGEVPEDDDEATQVTEVDNIAGLPAVDPATHALFYLEAEDMDPVLERVEHLLQVCGMYYFDARDKDGKPALSPSCRPIRFRLVHVKEPLMEEPISEFYLFAEIETEAGDLAGAEKQVNLVLKEMKKRADLFGIGAPSCEG
jgi:hypothetical protein